MNKSIAFKKAHKITKATIKAGESYAVNFAEVLKMVMRKARFDLNFWTGSKTGARRMYVKENFGLERDMGYVDLTDTTNKIPNYANVHPSIVDELKEAVAVKLFLDNGENFKGFEFYAIRMSSYV